MSLATVVPQLRRHVRRVHRQLMWKGEQLRLGTFNGQDEQDLHAKRSGASNGYGCQSTVG
jgi:hypothetical protein